jgi:hypothetical protein
MRLPGFAEPGFDRCTTGYWDGGDYLGWALPPIRPGRAKILE